MYYIIVILLLIYILNIKKQDSKLYNVISTIDNEQYLVEKTNDNLYDIKKADMLANVKLKIEILIQSLSSSDERKKLLESKKIKLQERDNRSNIGYTINKGDKIGLCITDDANTLFFVVLHELGHVITKSYGHDESFWKNFEFLIKAAVKLNIYDYKNYNKNPISYCNNDITYTPHLKNN